MGLSGLVAPDGAQPRGGAAHGAGRRGRQRGRPRTQGLWSAGVSHQTTTPGVLMYPNVHCSAFSPKTDTRGAPASRLPLRVTSAGAALLSETPSSVVFSVGADRAADCRVSLQLCRGARIPQCHRRGPSSRQLGWRFRSLYRSHRVLKGRSSPDAPTGMEGQTGCVS